MENIYRRNTRNWIDMLDELIRAYNNTIHSTIKMTPFEASKRKNENRILYTRYKKIKPIDDTPKFIAGDKIRISRIKGLFEKGYLPNWSE